MSEPSDFVECYACGDMVPLLHDFGSHKVCRSCLTFLEAEYAELQKMTIHDIREYLFLPEKY